MLNVYWNTKLKLPHEDKFTYFLNGMSKRIAQGHARYGKPNTEAKYLSRLKAEIKAYSKTGNAEALYNIANYAWLESVCPENKKFHYNPHVESNTRGKGF